MSRTLTGWAAWGGARGTGAGATRHARMGKDERLFVIKWLCIFKATDASRSHGIHNWSLLPIWTFGNGRGRLRQSMRLWVSLMAGSVLGTALFGAEPSSPLR